MALNKEIEVKIVKKLFADAAAVGWLNLKGDQRSDMYGKWIKDPDVGGRLTAFMTPEKARVWIKDGPMKEYIRSIYGMDKFADLVPNPAAGIGHLIERILGPGWEIDKRSRKVKPLRVKIVSNEEEYYFCWALGRDPKHLIWAAIEAESDGDPTPWILCLISSFENPITPDEQARNLRRAERCNLRIVHVDGH